MEVYYRKAKSFWATFVIFICGVAYLSFVFVLDLTDMRRQTHNDAIFYFLMAVIAFGALLMIFINWIYIRRFVKCVVGRHPALVLNDDNLRIYDSFSDNDIVLLWSQIEAFEPFEYKGKTTYYVVLKDYDIYYQQLSNRMRRFIMWTNGLIARRSVINIDTPMMDIDSDELLSMLHSHI